MRHARVPVLKYWPTDVAASQPQKPHGGRDNVTDVTVTQVTQVTQVAQMSRERSAICDRSKTP